MATLAAPKAPSGLIKLARWSMLGLGIMYGSARHKMLKIKEDAWRAKEEEERPAREAALKAEKDRRNQEEMEYLGREVGVIGKGKGGGGGEGGSGGSGGGAGSGKYQSDCGCSY